jgi:hypothetical protein
MTADVAVLAIAVAIVALGLMDRGVWFDRWMGAILIFGRPLFDSHGMRSSATSSRQTDLYSLPVFRSNYDSPGYLPWHSLCAILIITVYDLTIQ